MYYVYEWFIVETGEIIYVGKGTNRRYKVRKHNRFFDEMIKRFRCESRIVKEFETEKEAFDYEYVRVNELKRKGECVCNINKGGTGGSTEWWTIDRRQEYSEKNVMKSAKQRERMSENNPMKNREVSQNVSNQKKRPVVIGDKEYESVKDACESLGVYYDTIKLWCKKGANSKGEPCRFKDSEQVVYSDKHYNKGTSKGLVYKDTHYESALDLARDIGKSSYVVYGWLRNGFDVYGNRCQYDDDNRQLVFERKVGRSHPIVVNGIKYPSINNAAKSLGVDGTFLKSILCGKTQNAKYICEYDNQQPSQGNTDNSTLEGSTTNG